MRARWCDERNIWEEDVQSQKATGSPIGTALSHPDPLYFAQANVVSGLRLNGDDNQVHLHATVEAGVKCYANRPM